MVAEALKSIPFRWLMASNTAFFFALHGQMLSRSVVAWQLTGDEMGIAAINLAFAIPMIIFAFPGGVISDRVNRISLIKNCQVLLFANEAVVFILLVMGELQFWHILVSGLIAGILFPIVLPTRTAVVFNLVGNAVLGSATALSMTIINVSRIIGPALMGWLIAQYSITAAYGLATLLYFLAWLFSLGIDKKHAPQRKKLQAASPFTDVIEGITYVRNNKPVLLSLIFGMLPVTIAIPMHSIMLLFTEQIWMVGEKGLGVAMSIAGIGGTVGALWMTFRGENPRRTTLMFYGTISFTILLALFSISPIFSVALGLLFLANIGATVSTTLNNTITQLLTDDEQRGRVSSVMMMAVGFAPMAVVPIAWFAKQYGIDVALFSACTLLTLITIALYLFSDTVRQLDDQVSQVLNRNDKPKAPVVEIETPTGV